MCGILNQNGRNFMKWKSFFALECRLYRLPLLFFPLLGYVYLFLTYRLQMNSFLFSCGWRGGFASLFLEVCMLPSALVLSILAPVIRILPEPDFFIYVLCILTQLSIGYVFSMLLRPGGFSGTTRKGADHGQNLF